VDATNLMPCYQPWAVSQYSHVLHAKKTITVADTEPHPKSERLRAQKTLTEQMNRDRLLPPSPKNIPVHLSFEGHSSTSLNRRSRRRSGMRSADAVGGRLCCRSRLSHAFHCCIACQTGCLHATRGCHVLSARGVE
jgi:hypothetical protein